MCCDTSLGEYPSPFLPVIGFEIDVLIESTDNEKGRRRVCLDTSEFLKIAFERDAACGIQN